jgi:hypothetical protein
MRLRERKDVVARVPSRISSFDCGTELSMTAWDFLQRLRGPPEEET